MSYWKDKKVFLTGDSGFKGSWMALMLWRMGANVKGYSLPVATDPSHFQACNLGQKINHIDSDIRNYDTISKHISDFKPEVVFHLAAQALVRPSYRNPVETFESNVMGTVNLLNACRDIPSLKSVVIVTSDKCYENREWDWGYRENEPMGGSDPYSASKGAAELVTSSFRRSYFSNGTTHIASARAGNVIGGGDWAEGRLIPDLIRAFSQNQKLVIRNPSAVRPWQHVLDAISGYLLLAKRMSLDGDKFAKGWNFGPHEADSVNVSTLLNLCKEKWNDLPSWVVEGSSDHEAHLLKLDCSMARNQLSWQPVWQLKAAVEQTVGWYKSFYESPQKAEKISLEQIDLYLDKNRSFQ